MKTVLKNKNLQLYFAGQVVSLIGTWMQQMALSWLVYRLTNSTFMLGLIGFTSQAPSLFLTPFAGIVVDRVNRHRLIIATQVLAMLQAGLLATLVWSGRTQLWELVALSACLGMITAFDLPARQSFLIDMLDSKEQLPSAIGINSSINTSTRLLGPVIAGLVVTWGGECICFAVNAISYIAVIVALLFVKARQLPIAPSNKNTIQQLKEGVQYILAHEPIRDLICFLALVGLFALPFSVLMPAFAKNVFHGNAATLGLLNGASGAGAVAGAVFLASGKGRHNLGRWIVAQCALCGLALIVFGLSTFLPLSLLAVAAAGFSAMVLMAGSNTVIQTLVDNDKRGRVMSFVIMAFLGMAPFGCMIAGWFATKIGSGNTVVATGILTMSLVFILGSRISRIKPAHEPKEVNHTEASREKVSCPR